MTASYKGETKTGSIPYTWAHGYEWTVQILRYFYPCTSVLSCLPDELILYVKCMHTKRNVGIVRMLSTRRPLVLVNPNTMCVIFSYPNRQPRPTAL